MRGSSTALPGSSLAQRRGKLASNQGRSGFSSQQDNQELDWKLKPSRPVKMELDFNRLGRVHRIEPFAVRDIYEEFCALDVSGDAKLSLDEFKTSIRRKCHIADGEPIPQHLLTSQWRLVDGDGDGEIDFSEYLRWCVDHQWMEELMVQDPMERELRRVAREWKVDLITIEKVHKVYSACDTDGSGLLDETEFKEAVLKLTPHLEGELPAKKQKQLFAEVDTDRSGKINFEEFLMWYCNVGI